VRLEVEDRGGACTALGPISVHRGQGKPCPYVVLNNSAIVAVATSAREAQKSRIKGLHDESVFAKPRHFGQLSLEGMVRPSLSRSIRWAWSGRASQRQVG